MRIGPRWSLGWVVLAGVVGIGSERVCAVQPGSPTEFRYRGKAVVAAMYTASR
jgi:hypothetical protein